MEYIRKNLKSILIVAILAVGLVVGMYLVKNPQIFKSKADIQTVDQISGDNIRKLTPEEVKQLSLPGNEEGTVPTFKVQGKQFTIRYSP